ncbi:MAG: histidine phosphatase family protein [Nitrospira sp.]|nr:histidine phosphatase family protein [Nitrospira sp.]
MDCLFFRHGIAIERQKWSGQEQDRPLTDKGAARTRESGKGLLNLRIKPTHIFSSPLARAHDTAVILQSLIRSNPKIRICAELNPTAAPAHPVRAAGCAAAGRRRALYRP